MNSHGGAGDGNGGGDGEVWVYHERQEAALCGQHALNNLTQAPIFTVAQLSQIAQELDAKERSVMTDPAAAAIAASTPSANVDAMGNFSIQVLKQALAEEFGVSLPHLAVALRENPNVDIATFQGFVVHKSDHWFAIRQVGGRYFNLNSMLEIPIPVGHFKLATEMEAWQSQGYTVFAIVSGLPAGGSKIKGLGTGNWHKMSDLLKGKSTDADPWENLTGRGLRLDAGSSSGGGRSGGGGGGGALSSSYGAAGGGEDDDLQRALAMSLREHEAQRQEDELREVEVPPEPPAGAKNSVRLQVRLPDGRRVVRRFLATDSVRVVYAYARQEQQQSTGNNNGAAGSRRIELRYGFPPKDMTGIQNQTIGEAKLAGESIQGRYV